jgi:hypothetical protein
MLALYPNLIAVALHAYTSHDAMNFAEIDTLYNTYSQGAPLGAVDRICPGSSSVQTATFVYTWNGNIQQRLAAPAVLTLSIVSLLEFFNEKYYRAGRHQYCFQHAHG